MSTAGHGLRLRLPQVGRWAGACVCACRAVRFSFSHCPLPRARMAAVSEARHVGAHCSSNPVSLPHCVRRDSLRQLAPANL